MKRLWFFAIAFYGLFLLSHQTTVDASGEDYTTFANITLSSGKLLEDYSEDEMDDHLDEIHKRKFNGWRTKTLNHNVSASFISETLLSVYNTGSTPIEYELQTVTSKTSKMSISAKGGISYNVKGGSKTFKHGLDVEMKMEYAYSETIEIKQTEKFKITVDVNTMVLVYMTGTAKVTTGVARRYLVWISREKGGFEYFTMTDLYPRIEKIGI